MSPRKLTFGVACSLDHFIARADHSVDWLLWDDEVGAISGDFWKTIDTVVMGRKTYEVAVAKGTPVYPGVRNIVFSRTLREPMHRDVELVSGEAAGFVRNLKGEEGKGICVMGGGELARSLFQADLIDEFGLNIHPVLLGSGIPLFHEMRRQIDLDLIECKRLKNGCVYLLYRVGRER